MAVPYDESQAVRFGTGCNQTYEELIANGTPMGVDAGMVAVHSQREAWDAYVGGMSWDKAYTKHINEFRAEYKLPPLGSTTPVPPEPPTGPVTPIDRPPLPSFDPHSSDPDTGAFLPVYRTLREEPPSGPDVGWWRGDAWGLTVPGLPAVPGGANGPAQERVLTYFLDRYGQSWEAEILARYVGYGMTHISLSPQDSFAAGQSEDDYVRMSERCKKAGLFVHHLMRSKYYTASSGVQLARVQSPFQHRLKDRFRNGRLDVSTMMPPPAHPRSPDLTAPNALIERLLSEGLMDVETPAWEMNYWSPDTCRLMITNDSDLIGMRCRIMLHMFPHYISWQPNDQTPTDFWRANYGRVDGQLYQCNPSWSAGMMAARGQDCLDRLAPGGIWRLQDSGRGHPIDFVFWETIATCQYGNMKDGDNRLADEDQGNLKGYECTCAPGLMTVRGYGNGGRRPDGSRL